MAEGGVFWDVVQTRGGVRFCRELREGYLDGRNCVVLLPYGVAPQTVWAGLSAALGDLCYAHVLSLAAVAPDELPAVALAEAIGVGWPTGAQRSVENLLERDGLPEVIVLLDWEELPGAARGAWLRFVERWASTAQARRLAQRHTPVLYLLAAASGLWDGDISDMAKLGGMGAGADAGMDPTLPSLAVPETDVLLDVRCWWGLPVPLETRFECRERAATEADATGASALWREYALPAVCGGDAALAFSLWDAICGTEERIVALLREDAAARGWTREKLQSWGAGRFSRHIGDGTVARRPPPAMMALWAHGALSYTSEHGIELHSAALAALGRDHDVHHRLWRGQSTLLLPLLDDVRLRLCDHLTAQYGSSWPMRWGSPPQLDEWCAVQENPRACGWGHLKWLLFNILELRREARWCDLVSEAWRTRNDLAHYRCVPFERFLLLHNLIVHADREL